MGLEKGLSVGSSVNILGYILETDWLSLSLTTAADADLETHSVSFFLGIPHLTDIHNESFGSVFLSVASFALKYRPVYGKESASTTY